MKYKLQTRVRRLLADTLTPVNIYLKLRDVFAGSILLESSDYHGHENSLSFICCDPIASFQVAGEHIQIRYPDNARSSEKIASGNQVIKRLDEFRSSFDAERVHGKYLSSGLFGYIAYDAVRYFEEVGVTAEENGIPDVLYNVYRYVIVVDHFSNELMLFESTMEHDASPSQLDKLEKIIFSNRFSTFSFEAGQPETSSVSDERFLGMVEEGIRHCHRGDVFQIVLSRRFTRSFMGDEFNVYRCLRSINPSPYLFYFDYGNFKIFGSSPEAQIQVNNNIASIFPIAGTFKRSGNDHDDADLATRLAKDDKENAEHVMLVDLARNDLSRASSEVRVEVFKEIQYYSHVIHLVSKVAGTLRPGSSPLQLMADTFPAGTLSGAPKPMAMKLINDLETGSRGFYGGAIGVIGFTGDINHAIMIRTFLSRGNELTYQAGAGVVAKSVPQRELDEVNNKLEALRRAIQMAERI